MTDHALTPEALAELEDQQANRVARLDAADEAWSWHDATDDTIAGYGHHMSQMLARLPMDAQTRDMKTSIDAMVDDLRDVLYHLPALIAAARVNDHLRRSYDGIKRRLERAEDELDAALAEVAALRERVEAVPSSRASVYGPGSQVECLARNVRAALDVDTADHTDPCGREPDDRSDLRGDAPTSGQVAAAPPAGLDDWWIDRITALCDEWWNEPVGSRLMNIQAATRLMHILRAHRDRDVDTAALDAAPADRDDDGAEGGAE